MWRVFWVPQGVARTGVRPRVLAGWENLPTREKEAGVRAGDPILLSPDHRVDAPLGLYFQSSKFRRYRAETRRNYAQDIVGFPRNRGDFLKAVSCNFRVLPLTRTPVFPRFFSRVFLSPEGRSRCQCRTACRAPGRGRPVPALVSCRRSRRGLRGQGRPAGPPAEGRRASALEAGGAAPYPPRGTPPAPGRAARMGG